MKITHGLLVKHEDKYMKRDVKVTHDRMNE